MNPTAKQIFLGIGLGIWPLAVSALFYYLTPLLISGNAGSLLSFAVLALFLLSSIGAFVISIVFLSKNKTVIGGIALMLQVAQLIALFYILA